MVGTGSSGINVSRCKNMQYIQRYQLFKGPNLGWKCGQLVQGKVPFGHDEFENNKKRGWRTYSSVRLWRFWI